MRGASAGGYWRMAAVVGLGPSSQALIDCRGPIARQHLRDVDPVTALHLPDLFGAALFRGLAILGRDRIRIDQLLRESRLGEYAHDYGGRTAKVLSWKFPQSVFERSRPRFAEGKRGKTRGPGPHNEASEQARTEVQSVGREHERHGQADTAKHGDGLEHFDVDLRSGYACQNSCDSHHLRSPGLAPVERAVCGSCSPAGRPTHVNEVTCDRPTRIDRGKLIAAA